MHHFNRNYNQVEESGSAARFDRFPRKTNVMTKVCAGVLKRLPMLASLGGLFLAWSSTTQGATAPLAAGEPILLEKTSGKFDFIRIDTAKRRLLLAHTGNKSLDVFDLESRRVLKSVPTGTAQDSAV